MADQVWALDVLLHGKSVGTITCTVGDTTLFAFNSNYIQDPSRDTLGLYFRTAGDLLRTEVPSYRSHLMPFFSNLLPEGHLRTYLARQGGVHPQRELFLLWLLGEDLPGALTVRPVVSQPLPPPQAQEGEHNSDGTSVVDPAHVLRFSLAGVQLKLSAILESSGGLTIPAHGVGGAWIVKLPSQKFAGLPENEFSMMSLAGLVGMNVPEVRLIDITLIENLPHGIEAEILNSRLLDRKALAVERFDRIGDTRIHIEDFAQVFGLYPHEKYKKASSVNIAQVLGQQATEDDVAELVRRLVFNALIGNADMHVKNWSLIYPDRRTARLAPGYDFLCTTAYIADENAGLKVSRTRRYDKLSRDELVHFSHRAHVPENLVLRAAQETVERFHETWGREKSNLPLASSVIAAVEAQLSKIPLARGL